MSSRIMSPKTLAAHSFILSAISSIESVCDDANFLCSVGIGDLHSVIKSAISPISALICAKSPLLVSTCDISVVIGSTSMFICAGSFVTIGSIISSGALGACVSSVMGSLKASVSICVVLQDSRSISRALSGDISALGTS